MSCDASALNQHMTVMDQCPLREQWDKRYFRLGLCPRIVPLTTMRRWSPDLEQLRQDLPDGSRVIRWWSFTNAVAFLPETLRWWLRWQYVQVAWRAAIPGSQSLRRQHQFSLRALLVCSLISPGYGLTSLRPCAFWPSFLCLAAGTRAEFLSRRDVID